MPSGRGSADDLHAFLAPDKLEAKDDGQPEPRKTSARGSARYVHLVQITLQPASEVCRYLLFVLVGLAPFLLVRAPVGMAPVCTPSPDRLSIRFRPPTGPLACPPHMCTHMRRRRPYAPPPPVCAPAGRPPTGPLACPPICATAATAATRSAVHVTGAHHFWTGHSIQPALLLRHVEPDPCIRNCTPRRSADRLDDWVCTAGSDHRSTVIKRRFPPPSYSCSHPPPV